MPIGGQNYLADAQLQKLLGVVVKVPGAFPLEELGALRALLRDSAVKTPP
jgi:hypothetical protein